MRHVTLALLIALGAGLLGSTAHAPPAAAQKYVPKVQKRKARILQRKGILAYRRHRYKRAVELFRKAYEAWPRRELHFNIALSYGRLGDKVKAVIYLRRFVKDASSRELQSIPKWLRQMRQQVAVIKVQGPTGARVTMDGEEVGTVPLELVIMPGMHLFVVEQEGRRIAKRDWDVQPGLRRVWEVIEARPRPRVERPPPRRRIVEPPPPPPPAPGGISMAYTLTVGALAVAVAGAAVGTGVRAQSLHDDYRETPTRDTRDEGILMRNTTNALWGVAGALAVTSVVLAIFTRWSSSKGERSSHIPSIDVGVEPGGASVSLTGRF